MPFSKMFGSRPVLIIELGLVFAGSGLTQSIEWWEPSLPSVPSARCCGSMAYDAATHSTLLFGGGNGLISNVVYGDTWVFTRATGWKQLSPETSPSARAGAAMAYDPVARNIVLFGGSNGSGLNFGDTWTWDGTTWTQQYPPVSPPARGFNTDQMTYDAVTGTVVLFGGYGNNAALGDTWEWRGITKTWIQKFPASSPSPRGTTLTYDENLNQVVLFGGDNGGGDCCRTYYGDTWTWDGITWTQQFPASSPSKRTDLALVFDENIGAVVLFGGFLNPGNGLNDTWTWSGTTWSQVQTPFQPGGRWASSIAYDPFFKGLVLFGGEVTGDPFTNETWLFTLVR